MDRSESGDLRYLAQRAKVLSKRAGRPSASTRFFADDVRLLAETPSASPKKLQKALFKLCNELERDKYQCSSASDVVELQELVGLLRSIAHEQPVINTSPITRSRAILSLVLAFAFGVLGGAGAALFLDNFEVPTLQQSGVAPEGLANLLRFFGGLIGGPVAVIGSLVAVPWMFMGAAFEVLGKPSKALLRSTLALSLFSAAGTAVIFHNQWN